MGTGKEKSLENFKVLHSETPYKGKILDIKRDEILFDNGNKAVREVVDKHEGGSAVVALDEEGKMIFVSQYRYASRCPMLEIPAGLYNPGETPEECARRELEEETGLRAERAVYLFDMWASPGYVTEKITVYWCQNFTQTSQHLDADEFIHVVRLSPQEAAEKIRKGEITDAKTMAAVFAVASGYLDKIH